MTHSVDPLGRQFTYTYAANDIDLLEVNETQASDKYLLGEWAYGDASAPHRPTSYIDGSGQETQYTYSNSAPYGELLTITDANSNTTTLSYNGDGYLTQIQGPLAGSDDVTNFTFFGYGVPETVTDSEGYELVFAYDDLNRLTSTTYPDGTTDKTTYNLLDPVMSADRLGRTSRGSYDRLDQLISETDPLGRTTRYCWCPCGSLKTLTDPAGHVTTWNHDLEGRPIRKVYADQSSWSYSYAPTNGLLTSQTDALNQTKSFTYNLTNAVEYLNYTNVVNATSPVAMVYDDFFPRTTSATNGWGQLSYAYNPYAINNSTAPADTAYIFIGGYPQTPNATDTISTTFFNSALSGGQYTMPTYSVLSGDAGNPSAVATHYAAAITSNSTLSAAGISATASGPLVTIAAGSAITVSPSATGSTTATLGGGGRLAQVTNNVIPNSPITYSYDDLERTTTRMINGGNNNISWQYDAMSRITSETNALGTFDYAYVDDVSGSSKGTLRLQSISYPNGQMTNFSWYPTAQDERLQQISNLNPSSALLSQFSYRYDSAGEITQWQQIQNNTSKFYQLAYDAAGQLTAAKAGNGTPAPNSLNQNYYAYDCAANRLSQQASAIVNGAIAGAVTSGDSITITVSDPALSGGSQAVTYNVQSGDTLSTISANLAAAVTANSNLQAIGVNATSNGTNFTLRSCSKNITSYAESTSGGATETVALNRSANFIENVVVGGTKTTSDSLTLTVYDSALSGGSQAVSYSVGGSDTLDTIAAGITSAINGNLALSTLGVTATSASAVVTITSASTNATTYAESTNSGATETLTLSINQNPAQTTLISGTLTVSDQLKITVYDSALGGGSETVEYTTALGNTTTAMATGLTSAINADTNLQNLGVSATSSGPVITITSNSPNATTYANASASSITELISFGVPVNGTQTAAIAGTKSTGDQLSITVFDAGLSGGSKTDSYTVLSGDTLSSICAGLASVINGDSSLSAIGVSATAVSTVLNLKSSSVNCTTYSQSVSSGATETITLSPTTGVQQAAYNCVNELVSQSAGGNVLFQGSTARPITSAVINPNQTATVGGTITANDILTLSVHNSALSHAENVQYTVQGGDSTTSIATHLTSNINADSNLSGIGVSATSSGAIITITSTSVNPTFYTETLSSGATETIAFNGSSSAAANLASSLNFSGSPVLATGSNTAEVTAVSGGGTAKTNPYQITLNSGSSTSLTFDANGNMTSDGTNSYSYDAENRLIEIVYPGSGNNSLFSYDPYGRNVQILEYVSSSLTSTKNFVWDGAQPDEARNSAFTITAQYFALGQTISGTSYFYAKDHIGSIREMTNSGGSIQDELAYDSYGQPTTLQGSIAPDYQYGQYYFHAASSLNMMLNRLYSSRLGRFINRDPIEEAGGLNLYDYVENDPIEDIDPEGTQGITEWQIDLCKMFPWLPGCKPKCQQGADIGGGGGELKAQAARRAPPPGGDLHRVMNKLTVEFAMQIIPVGRVGKTVVGPIWKPVIKSLKNVPGALQVP